MRLRNGVIYYGFLFGALGDMLQLQSQAAEQRGE